MGELSAKRLGAVRQLIEQVPDGAIRTLETALANTPRGDRMAVVQDIVSTELLERRARGAAFSPLVPLCGPPPDGLQRLVFPPQSLTLTWRALKIASPETVDQVLRAFATLRPEDETPVVFDDVCREAAAGMRSDRDCFRPLIAMLKARGPELPGRFADTLALAPLVRSAIARLPIWVKTLSNEHAAAIRLAFRDAMAVGDDAGPPFMEMLFGHLEQPHEVLRLISLVMDKPSDRYLASSELASFGERLLGDLDRRIEDIRKFDPERGLEGGVALAHSIQVATTMINEFEQWLAINREGPWGTRLTASKRSLATAVEARLREVEPAVSAALPSQAVRSSSKTARGSPKLEIDPEPLAVLKAQALLGFLYESRTAANYGGYGTVRTKVIEALDPRIDQYAEDLLEALHAGDKAPPDRIRAFLEVAAEFLGLVRDPKSAEIVRRRAAVA